jgi:hypothetical protein
MAEAGAATEAVVVGAVAGAAAVVAIAGIGAAVIAGTEAIAGRIRFKS